MSGGYGKAQLCAVPTAVGPVRSTRWSTRRSENGKPREGAGLPQSTRRTRRRIPVGSLGATRGPDGCSVSDRRSNDAPNRSPAADPAPWHPERTSPFTGLSAFSWDSLAPGKAGSKPALSGTAADPPACPSLQSGYFILRGNVPGLSATYMPISSVPFMTWRLSGTRLPRNVGRRPHAGLLACCRPTPGKRSRHPPARVTECGEVMPRSVGTSPLMSRIWSRANRFARAERTH